MTQLKIDIRGLDKLIRKMKASTKDTVLMEGMFVVGQNFAGWSKEKRLSGPRPKFLGVDTGRLISSIAVTRTIKRGSGYLTRFGTNVVYGRAHELGSKRVPKRPFLRPSLEDRGNQKDAINILSRRIELSMRGQN